ncbi:MAG: MBOAT family protein [Bacteroidia bacterium]|nr:MBOAT family protein [Bacteroidia bacterium]
MLFNSFSFLFFFPFVTGLYFLLPHKYRWLLLLTASCIFYMAFIPEYILILFITILIDYFAGIYIEKSTDSKKKKYLIISIISTCLVLFVFKYFNFFNLNFAKLARVLDLNYPIDVLKIILPIGLSFHTFQSLSYVIEVYRGNQKVEKNFGIYSLYVMFYPQLVAGPIERPQNLLPQFYQKHTFDYKRVTDGLKLMAWGMFKKVVIADRLAILVNQIYDTPGEHSGAVLFLATFFFAFQIYCDFSGYSDIALGAAQVMGFKLMRNFNRPYLSKSISEFWKRWHISLSSWFRDYMYISLGGNRVVKWRWYYNLFITFTISGLWHGANWTFIIWGALNGFYLVFAILTDNTKMKIAKFIGLHKIPKANIVLNVLFTFALTCFAWIFFRARSLSDAFLIIKKIFISLFEFIINLKNIILKSSIITSNFISSDFISFWNTNSKSIIISFILLIFLTIIQIYQRRGSLIQIISEKSLLFRWSSYFILVFAIYYLGVFDNTAFIYFQF